MTRPAEAPHAFAADDRPGCREPARLAPQPDERPARERGSFADQITRSAFAAAHLKRKGRG